MPELTVVQALAKFDAAKKYVDNSFRTDWDNYFRIYRRQRVNRHYEGISDPVIPEAHTIIETLVANIAGGNIKFHFVKTNEEQTDEVDVLNGALDYYLECESMGLKNQEWVRDMLLYGTGILHVTWDFTVNRPRIANIPLRDFFVDPQATNMENATYAGFVYLGDKDVMKNQKVFDAAKNQWVPKYDLPDTLGVAQTSDVKLTDKQFKDQFQGSTLSLEDALIQQVAVILLYDLKTGKIYEIGNRKMFVYKDDIPYQREEQTRQVDIYGPDGKAIKSKQTLDEIEAFMPFAVLRDYIDTSQFFGEGEMAQMADRSEMLNDLEAMDTDNLAVTGTPMFQIDPQFADMAAEIETIPGAIYPIPKGAMSPIPIAEISVNLDAKKDRVIASMRNATAADEQIQGITQDQGRITATEVQSTLTQAQNRFSTKIENLENEGYAQLAKIIFKMMQIFVDTKQVIRIVGKQGVYFKDYDPWDFNGEWQPNAELDITQKQKQMEVGQKLNQVFEYMKDNPIFDPVESSRFIMQKLDPDLSNEEFNSMLTKQQGPTEGEQKMQAELKKSELMATAEIYRFTTPFIQAQIETILGMNPDPMHEAQEHQATVQMGAEQADLMNPATTAAGNEEPMLTPPAPVPAQQPAGMAA